MACGTNTGVQSGIIGDPIGIDIHCLQPTNGVPNFIPSADQLPFAYDSDTDTVYIFSCESNSWRVIAGSFSLCGLTPVDLNVLNPANICGDVNVPVIYDLGGQCIQGKIPFSELIERLERCGTPFPDVVSSDSSIDVTPSVDPISGQTTYDVSYDAPAAPDVISSNASITVTPIVNPTTGQVTYDLADNGIANVVIEGPDANGVYTLIATYEDGSTQEFPLDTSVTNSDTWTNIVDNGDGTFTATLPDGSTVTWTSDTGTPPPATVNTHLSNPRYIDDTGDGISDIVRWDLVTDAGVVVGTVDQDIFHQVFEARGMSPVPPPPGGGGAFWTSFGNAIGDFPLLSLSYTNTNNFPVRCRFKSSVLGHRFVRTGSGGIYDSCYIYATTLRDGISLPNTRDNIPLAIVLEDERGHNTPNSINKFQACSACYESAVILPGSTMSCDLRFFIHSHTSNVENMVTYSLEYEVMGL